MIVEESQLKGSRFYENLEPDVSPGYTGKLNAGKYIELAGTKKLTIPISNKAENDPLNLFDHFTIAGPNCVLQTRTNVRCDGDHVTPGEGILSVHLSSTTIVETLFNFKLVVDDAYHDPVNDSLNKPMPNVVNFTKIDYGTGWKDLYYVNFTRGQKLMLKVPIGVNVIKLKFDTQFPFSVKYHNEEVHAITYVGTYITYYDIDDRGHKQIKIPYSTSYEFKDIKINNIMTTFSRFKSTDIKHLDNEPESILKTLYGGTPVAGNININDLTRYYPVMEDRERVYNILAKLAGPMLMFSSVNPTTKMEYRSDIESSVKVNSIDHLIKTGDSGYNHPWSIASDNVLSDGEIRISFEHYEEITLLKFTDAKLTEFFPDLSAYTKLELISFFNTLLVGSAVGIEKLLPPSLKSFYISSVTWGDIDGIDFRKTTLESITVIGMKAMYGSMYGLLPDTIVSYNFAGCGGTTAHPGSLSQDCFTNKIKLESFLCRDNTRTVTGPLPEPTDCVELKEIDLARMNLGGPVPTFVTNTKLENVRLSSLNMIGPFPEFVNTPNLKNIIIMYNTITGSFPVSWKNLSNLTILDLILVHKHIPASGGNPEVIGLELTKDAMNNLPSSLIKINFYDSTAIDCDLPTDIDTRFPNLKYIDMTNTKVTCNDLSFLERYSHKFTKISFSGCHSISGLFPDLNKINSTIIDFTGTDLTGNINMSTPSFPMQSLIISKYQGYILPRITGTIFDTSLIPSKGMNDFFLSNMDISGTLGTFANWDTPLNGNGSGVKIKDLPNLTGDIPTLSHIIGGGHFNFIFTELSGVTGYAGDATTVEGNPMSSARNYSNCALTQQAIDDILVAFSNGTSDSSLTLVLDNYALAANTTYGNIEIVAGTNAAPSSVGEAAIDIIKARGSKVYTAGTYAMAPTPRPTNLIVF